MERREMETLLEYETPVEEETLAAETVSHQERAHNGLSNLVNCPRGRVNQSIQAYKHLVELEESTAGDWER